MRFKEMLTNKIFLSLFTREELEEIEPYCYGVGDDTFVIFTEKYFFEVYLDNGELLIYYDSDVNPDDAGIISKDTFFKLLKESPVMYPNVIAVNE